MLSTPSKVVRRRLDTDAEGPVTVLVPLPEKPAAIALGVRVITPDESVSE